MLPARTSLAFWVVYLSLAFGASAQDLPSSKRLARVVGSPKRVNAMATAAAVTSDGKRIAFVHTGYGYKGNHTEQSITVADASGKLHQFDESRLKVKAKQTYSFGIAFGQDGKHLYVPFASETDPTGKQTGSTGNAIGVYAVRGRSLKPERTIPLPLVTLSPGKTAMKLAEEVAAGSQLPFPAGVSAFVRDGKEKLLIAEQISDTAAILDIASGHMDALVDVGTDQTVPSAYPFAAVTDRAANFGYISLWNQSEVVEIDLANATVSRRFALRKPDQATGAGSHPTAMLLSHDGKVLYVALANRDEVAAVDLPSGHVEYVRTSPEPQKYFGAYPNALAESPDGDLLFVANAGQNSVSVLRHDHGALTLLGAIPTEWYPTSLAVLKDSLFIASGKGNGTGPNATHHKQEYVYGPRLEHGSVARLRIGDLLKTLPAATQEVIASNRYLDAQQQFQWQGGRNPIKHVIYIIKENRTYDQLFGDIKGADGDAKLVMFGEEVTPNQHALARQFGVFDNFYDSGEVSGSGHVWSTAAITSDYTERIWPIAYRGSERTYDFEGEVANGIPLEARIADVNEPGTGYIWTNLAHEHRTYRHYGEYIVSTWCTPGDEVQHPAPKTESKCAAKSVAPGQPFPASMGPLAGTVNPYPWPVPLLKSNEATKPELQGHFDPLYPDFELDYPDQLRADEFLHEFAGFVRDRQAGREGMPDFVLIRLPNDHTSGTKAGKPSPRAQVADNDLALGRIVEAVSHSPYWDDTAIFAIEDDAQNGPDHVDAHRSIALLISKYAPTAEVGKLFVEHGFYTTVNVIHTMEALLGLPPMNANDAYAPLIWRSYTGNGAQPPFRADYRNQQNRLLYETNAPNAPGAKQSAKLDFSHADAADSSVLNQVLWRATKGDNKMPRPVHRAFVSDEAPDEDDR